MLSELEKEKLQILNKDEGTKTALHKLFMETIKNNCPEIKDDDSDERMGQKYRAFEISKRILNHAFDVLGTFEEVKVEEKTPSRAR